MWAVEDLIEFASPEFVPFFRVLLLLTSHVSFLPEINIRAVDINLPVVDLVQEGDCPWNINLQLCCLVVLDSFANVLKIIQECTFVGDLQICVHREFSGDFTLGIFELAKLTQLHEVDKLRDHKNISSQWVMLFLFSEWG